MTSPPFDAASFLDPYKHHESPSLLNHFPRVKTEESILGRDEVGRVIACWKTKPKNDGAEGQRELLCSCLADPAYKRRENRVPPPQNGSQTEF